jgi:hypothetical protein
MSTAEDKNGPKVRYETVLNAVRRELQKIREASEKLEALRRDMEVANHPAPATILDEARTTISVGLEHARAVFREF